MSSTHDSDNGSRPPSLTPSDLADDATSSDDVEPLEEIATSEDSELAHRPLEGQGAETSDIKREFYEDEERLRSDPVVGSLGVARLFMVVADVSLLSLNATPWWLFPTWAEDVLGMTRVLIFDGLSLMMSYAGKGDFCAPDCLYRWAGGQCVRHDRLIPGFLWTIVEATCPVCLHHGVPTIYARMRYHETWGPRQNPATVLSRDLFCAMRGTKEARERREGVRCWGRDHQVVFEHCPEGTVRHIIPVNRKPRAKPPRRRVQHEADTQSNDEDLVQGYDAVADTNRTLVRAPQEPAARRLSTDSSSDDDSEVSQLLGNRARDEDQDWDEDRLEVTALMAPRGEQERPFERYEAELLAERGHAARHSSTPEPQQHQSFEPDLPSVSQGRLRRHRHDRHPFRLVAQPLTAEEIARLEEENIERAKRASLVSRVKAREAGYYAALSPQTKGYKHGTSNHQVVGGSGAR